METIPGSQPSATVGGCDGPAKRRGGHVIDLAGKRFGRLVADSRHRRRVGHNAVWLCSYGCGGERKAQANHLKQGAVLSCGCHRRRDVLGERFGRLVAVRPTGDRRSGRAVWLCSYDCGRERETVLDYLLAVSTCSRGCLRREVASEQMRRIHAGRAPGAPVEGDAATPQEAEPPTRGGPRRRGRRGAQGRPDLHSHCPARGRPRSVLDKAGRFLARAT